MTALRLLSAAIAAVFVGSVPSASLHAQNTSTTLSPTVDAWYVPDPVCAPQPVNCVGGVLPARPATPGPARTMHVAAAASRELARTYLTFDLEKLQGDITQASLMVPLDTAGGSLSPETSAVIACTWAGSIVNADASLQPPPIPNCRKFAALTYKAAPAPHLEGNLNAIAAQLATASGLVLMPDAKKVTPTGAWHVVFSAHDRGVAAITAPPSLSVTTTPFTADDEPVDEVVTEEPFVSDFDGSTGFFTPAIDIPEPRVAEPRVPAVITPQTRSVFFPYAYPQVWLLPLALLVLVGAAGSVLTREIKE